MRRAELPLRINPIANNSKPGLPIFCYSKKHGGNPIMDEADIAAIKRRINELSKKLGEPLPYDLSFIEEEVKRCD